jgi:adenylylsulfate kinase
LSGSGKSTIAAALEKFLLEHAHSIKPLDGDNIRMGLNKDLGFSNEDRKENIRRIAEVAKLFSDTGIITVTSFISPFEEDRNIAREIIGEYNFIQVYVKTPLEVCERRDPKGLYKKVRKGEIKNFTGIDSPYEEPKNPHIVLDTTVLTVEQCVQTIVNYLVHFGTVNEKLYKNIDKGWGFTNHGNTNVKNNGKQKAVFIGRYQPYHYGHIRLVEQKLNKGIPVLIMVRDIAPEDKNPFTTEQTVDMIRKYHMWKGHDVEVMIIPDIESVNYGRGVGYEINEYEPPKDIENISATFIRDCISKGSDDWRDVVDTVLQEDIVKYLDEYSKSKKAYS